MTTTAMSGRKGMMWCRRLAALVAGIMLAGSPVASQAQSGNPLNILDNIFNSGQRQAQAPSAPAPAAGASAPLPWTGEDGASGHPLMTAAAIREAAANFDSCVAGLWPDAARRGISEQGFRDITAELTKLAVPCHLLVGAHDEAITPATQRRLTLPHLPASSAFTEVPEAGHLLPLEVPEVVAAALA